MKELKSEFLLPVKGMHPGLHEYKFKVTDAFFKMFEHSLLQQGLFDVNLNLERKPTMIVLDFEVVGYKEAPCDVCLKQIQIPVVASDQYIVKFFDDGTSADGVIILKEDDAELDVSPMVLETIQLHLPLMNKIDCEERDYEDCDQKMLNYLDKEIEKKKEEGNDIWGDLKKIKLNK